MSFATVLPVLSSLVPDSVYESGILSVKFKSLNGRVVFFRPFVSRKSSSGLFVERVVAVFPNGELHLFDADAKPKRGVNLARITSVVSEGSTVVLISGDSDQEDLQLRFDSGPGAAQKQLTTRVNIRDPAEDNSGDFEARTSLSTPKQFVSVVSHFSPSVAKLSDAPIDELELDLAKRANFARPTNLVAAATALACFNNRRPTNDEEALHSQRHGDTGANQAHDETVSHSGSSVMDASAADPLPGADLPREEEPPTAAPRVAFRDVVSSQPVFDLADDPNEASDQMRAVNVVMFGQLKGMLDGLQSPPPAVKTEEVEEDWHPQLHSTMSSLQYRQLMAERLREHKNREAFLERQRSYRPDSSQPGPRSIIDFERLFTGSSSNIAGNSMLDQADKEDEDGSPGRVLERLRAKHTELTMQNLMLKGELRGLEHVKQTIAQNYAVAPADHSFSRPDVETVTLYRDASGTAGRPAPAIQLIPTKQYQRAINLSVLVLNVCRKRRQAVLQAVRQSRIEEERRALEGQYFVSSGLPMAMMSA